MVDPAAIPILEHSFQNVRESCAYERACAHARTRTARKKKWASLTYVCARAGESGNERNEWRVRDAHLGTKSETSRRRERWRVSDCLEG